MSARRDDPGTFGLALVLVPWLSMPFAAFFLFFGDAPPDAPDPRDRMAVGYLALTGLLALVGVVLAIVRRNGHVARMIAALVIGGGWIAVATMVLVNVLRR